MSLVEIPCKRSLRDFVQGPNYDQRNDLVGVVLGNGQIVYVGRTMTGIWYVDDVLMPLPMREQLVRSWLSYDKAGRARIDVPSDVCVGKPMRFRMGASLRVINKVTAGTVINFVLTHRNSATMTDVTIITAPSRPA